jgi:hypothetical protein
VNPRPKAVKQFTRSCAFCRRPARMTNEHVWGNWLKPYVHRIANKHILHQTTVDVQGSERHKLEIRAGASPLHSKVPVVCGDCNSTWLGRIQETAKPHLLPLVEGRENVLVGPAAQKAIATWATMATITGEFIHRKLASIAISHEAREVFKDMRAPFASWRIWIGYYHRLKWDGCYVHACRPIYLEGEIVPPNVQDPSTPLPTTQWSTFVVGKLYVHTASSMRAADWIAEWDWKNAPRASQLLVQIWPPKEPIIAWPIQGLTDADAWRFSHAHWALLNRETPVYRL